MRIQILILGFKGSTPTEKRTTQSTDFKGVCYIPVHPNIVGNNKTVQKSRKIVDYNLTFVFKSGWKSLCSFHSFIKHMHTYKAKKKYIYIYISYLLFSLKPFIFANNILNIRSRCSQVSSAMSTFPWIPVHRSASLRSSKTLFVLLSNWRKVLTRGKLPLPPCASSMRCW